MDIRKPALLLAFAIAVPAFGQTDSSAPKSTPNGQTEPATPDSSLTPAPSTTPKKVPDRAQAYYHYSLAHMYEELVSIYQSSEFANKAIEEYRLALENDPNSEYLNSGLAELYAKTGRIRDAVEEAQDIIKRDPNNLDARKLLGRIYLRGLGDQQTGAQSQDILKRAIEQYEQIVRLEPNNIENHMLLGRLYRLNNEFLKAENEFKTAVALQPNSEEAVTMLAILYNEEGDSKRAAQVLNAVPEADRTSKIYSALGYTYEQQHDYKSAITAYRAAINEDKDNLEAMRGLAQSLLNENQTEAALETLKQIVEADPHDAQSYMRMAEVYRRTGRFDAALDALKKAGNELQDSLEVPFNEAVIYQSQGNFDQAAQLLQQLLKKSEKPDNSYTTGERNNRAVFLERLGSVYRDQNKTQLAVDTFRKEIELGDPDTGSRAYQQIIDTYQNAKDWKSATAIAQEAVNKFPKDRNLQLILAGQLADSGQADQAIAQVKGMLKGNADDRDTYISLAQMYARLKRYPEAEDAINHALQLSTKPDDKRYAQFVQGSIFEREKKYDQAEDVFKQLINSDPSDAQSLNYLGYILADRGVRLDEALGYIKRAVQIDPQNGAYLDSLGWAYYKLGNYDLAEDYLRRAVDRANNDPTVLDHLGDLFQKTDRLKLAAGVWERALHEWTKAVPADVDSNDVAKVQKKLDAARVKLARENGGVATPTQKP
ncbi:MAG TPA: tetratricopeptide repeat protein [Terriglobales bacterium]|nr:tetratricopeptide repeat protein [Terriglobales bacterium]